MKEKKHIDRLFQEKLKNFEALPDDAVWNKINAQLRKDKEDDRKVIPFWWKIAGVAAGMLLLLTIGNLVFNKSIIESTQVPTEIVAETINNQTESKKQNNTIIPEDDSLNSNQKTEEELTSQENNSLGDENESKNKVSPNASNQTATKQKSKVASNNSEEKTKKYNTNTTVTQQEGSLNNLKKDNLEPKKTTDEGVANNMPHNLPEQPRLQQNLEKELQPNTQPSVSETVAEANTITEKENANTNTTDEVKDSSIEETVALSEDEERINEKEKEVINRWSVTPNVSPVYFNSLGKGSSIDSQFNDNSKSGEINVAYGVIASYAISDKIRIRSGVNKVNVGYTTNDVVVYQSIGPSFADNSVRNIDMSASVADVSIISGETLAFSQTPIFTQDFKTALNQEISFIEIPVEIEYKVSDKKVDINLIGGVSTMILNDNNVYTEVNNERMLIGKANNINTVSYSANIGVGLDYEIFNSVSLNVEPTFKYQINTFNNTSGDFKPYIIGVNSGIKFKF